MPLQRRTDTGALLLSGPSLANECCCSEPAPCVCDWWPGPGPAPNPQVQAGSLALFPNCPVDCEQFTIEPAWDGIMPLIGLCDGAIFTFSAHLNGNLIDAIFNLFVSPPICEWQITLTCKDPMTGMGGDFWLYIKTLGTDPFGTYLLSGTSTACVGAPPTIDVQPA